MYVLVVCIGMSCYSISSTHTPIGLTGRCSLASNYQLYISTQLTPPSDTIRVYIHEHIYRVSLYVCLHLSDLFAFFLNLSILGVSYRSIGSHKNVNKHKLPSGKNVRLSGSFEASKFGVY